MVAGMRGLFGAALAVLPALSGLVSANAQDTSTAVIPLDLTQHEFGRELTLLITVAETPEPCGPSDVQINGRSLSTAAGDAGVDTLYEDYGSEVVASWALTCARSGDEPAHRSLTVEIDSLDGVPYEDLVFSVAFHQSSPVAILSVDGPLVNIPAVDLSADADYWAQHHGLEGEEAEIAAAIAEMQFLRVQQREIGDRIRVLETFIQESDPQIVVCRGRFRCMVRGFLNKVAGMAHKAYETVMGPEAGEGPEDQYHGNGTHEATPARKRPEWRPPFCPCAPSSTPTAPPVDPGRPADPVTGDDDEADSSPDVPDPAATHVDPPKSDTPAEKPDSDSEDESQETLPVDTQSSHSHSPASQSLLIFLIILLAASSIFLLRRAATHITAWHRRHVLRREQRWHRRRAAAATFFRSLVPARPSCLEADMEQQWYPATTPPPPPPQQRQEAQGRGSRSQSDASNTMEQDLAQFRAAVDMVGSLVGAGAERSEVQPARGGAPERRSFAGYGYQEDLPPAYESEEEGAPMLSAVSDGFRQGYGSGGYSPGRGDSGGNADSLGYS